MVDLSAKPKRMAKGISIPVCKGRGVEMSIVFNTSMCSRVMKYMSEGATRGEICRKLKISNDVFQGLLERFPQFREAYEIGKDFSRGWWEEQGRINLENTKFNSTLWYMNMKNRWGWKDKQEIEHGVNDRLADLMKEISSGGTGLPVREAVERPVVEAEQPVLDYRREIQSGEIQDAPGTDETLGQSVELECTLEEPTARVYDAD